MIDLRRKTQYINEYYIWKDKYGFKVGKNGTSDHTYFKKKDYNNNKELKSAMYKYIGTKTKTAEYIDTSSINFVTKYHNGIEAYYISVESNYERYANAILRRDMTISDSTNIKNFENIISNADKKRLEKLIQKFGNTPEYIGGWFIDEKDAKETIKTACKKKQLEVV